MKYFKYLLFFLFFLASAPKGQEAFPLIEKNDLPEASLKRAEFFDGKSLWGYMDGGADVYLEYGFKKLLVQELNLNGKHYTLNIFKMSDSAAAYGIYSMLRYKCFADSIEKYSCLTAYQVQVSRGDFYISIINDDGTKETQQTGKRLTGIILAKIHNSDFQPPALFQKKFFKGNLAQLKLFNGKLGLQNVLPEISDMFEYFSGFRVYYISTEINGGYFNLAQVIFPTESDKDSFLKNNNIAAENAEFPIINKKGTNTEVILKEKEKRNLIMITSDLPAVQITNIIRELEN